MIGNLSPEGITGSVVATLETVQLTDTGRVALECSSLCPGCQAQAGGQLALEEENE